MNGLRVTAQVHWHCFRGLDLEMPASFFWIPVIPARRFCHHRWRFPPSPYMFCFLFQEEGNLHPSFSARGSGPLASLTQAISKLQEHKSPTYLCLLLTQPPYASRPAPLYSATLPLPPAQLSLSWILPHRGHSATRLFSTIRAQVGELLTSSG